MIYLASSWRNEFYQHVLDKLLSEGEEVYDFRSHNGFSWSDIDMHWEQWNVVQYVVALRNNPRAISGYLTDLRALKECHALVMVQPCGRSAHLELGQAMGMDKPTCIYYPDASANGFEAELMVAGADLLTVNIDDVLYWLKEIKHAK